MKRTVPTFHDFPNHKTMVVMDGRRRICVAQYHSGMKAWFMKADGFCWTDPLARKPNVFGIVRPEFMFIKTKREARCILKALTSG